MSASPLTTEQLDRSVARLSGKIVLPGDASWDEARHAWNLAVDQRPAAVALPETAAGRRRARRFAREHGLRVAPQGTGHNAAPLGPLDDTILLKTDRMRGVDDRPGRAGSPASRPARCGWTSSRPRPSTASPRSPAPRPTSASSATRSAAASAGSAASTASPPTACSRSSS